MNMKPEPSVIHLYDWFALSRYMNKQYGYKEKDVEDAICRCAYDDITNGCMINIEEDMIENSEILRILYEEFSFEETVSVWIAW